MTSPRALSIGLGGLVAFAGAIGSQSCVAPDAGYSNVADPECVNALVDKLEPELDVCRSCHISGGIAEAKGSAFILSSNAAEDGQRIYKAWDAIGANMLFRPSEAQGLKHTGGPLLQPNTPAYDAMSMMLSSFAGSSTCKSVDTIQEYPLIESSRGGHLWATFCDGKPDSTPLPVDPRTLVKKGVNDGKAAYMNAYWVDCVDPSSPKTPPVTCGDYRASYARGKDVMEEGKMWFFGGNFTDAMLIISSATYNNMWLEWGYTSRPANYDQIIAERWGLPMSSKKNPYPLNGEDPNKTNGGSGQLPVALTQIRDQNGKYTGNMSFNCHWCHSGKVGDESEGEGLGTQYGSGNPLADLSTSFGYFAAQLSALIPIVANKTRGTGDILLYPAIGALDYDRAQHYNTSIANAPSQGSVEYPQWWNSGHRTRRFHDGSFAQADGRPVMGFFIPILTVSKFMNLDVGRAWIEQRSQDVQTWLESIKAPKYPAKVDTQLATAGAVLFHNKDLWNPELNNPEPKPTAGNGSCAGCHGVYAPRFTNDTRYLDQPELEGIGANVVPIDVIKTDPARFNSLNDGLQEMLKYTWWGYGENNKEGACFGTVEPGGYLAPPLYGVWASAPYFHNGSVPNIWEVLSPKDRKTIWRRVSSPAMDNNKNTVMGYDTNLARAYDFTKLGWKYEELSCDSTGAQAWLDCSPATVETTPAIDKLLGTGFDQFWFTWNVKPQPFSSSELEQRKIYNTKKYSQSNVGHEFTAVLTDLERKALIEYLKTL